MPHPHDDSELPVWARLHIPPDPLAVETPGRRRRTLFARAVHETHPNTEVQALPIDDSESKDPRISKRAVAALVGGVVIAVSSGLAGVALATPDDGQSVAVPDLIAAEQGSVIPVADFCPDRTDGAAITTSGPGSESSAAGVIAAFDYAYYSERNGQRVADLMVNPPSTVPAIQSAIDAIAAGTRACVTTRPTDDPLIFDVDVMLQAPTGSQGELRQRITVTQTGSGFQIARVEDRR